MIQIWLQRLIKYLVQHTLLDIYIFQINAEYAFYGFSIYFKFRDVTNYYFGVYVSINILRQLKHLFVYSGLFLCRISLHITWWGVKTIYGPSEKQKISGQIISLFYIVWNIKHVNVYTLNVEEQSSAKTKRKTVLLLRERERERKRDR